MAPKGIILLLIVIGSSTCDCQGANISSGNAKGRVFEIDYANNGFLKDGQPYRYISGTIHYFRVPRQYWRDRLEKLKALGCNALQTYVMWFWHEPEQGRFDFSGSVNISEYLTIAQQLGLDVILRLGPYSDSEQDMGGFPAWTLKYRSIKYRTSDDQYRQLVKAWWDQLLPRISPFLYPNGGPVIMVQVENEYGYWGACDHNYTQWLFQLARSHLGEGIVYFTTDGLVQRWVDCGHIPGTYATIDFGSGTNEQQVQDHFRLQRTVAPKGPLINSEFYPGWFSQWGSPYVYTPAEPVIETMRAMYSLNASFNIYMTHGGTNFGYTAGSEHIGDSPFQSITTSYDWSAPIREDGLIGKKFIKIQQAIHELTGKPKLAPPPPTLRMAYGSIEMKYYGTVFDNLDKLSTEPLVHSQFPLSSEDIDHYYGFTLYETFLPKELTKIEINASRVVHDRGYFIVDRQYVVGVIQRGEKKTENSLFYINFPKEKQRFTKMHTLSILVENQGRICYTERLADRKGLVGNVTANGNPLQNWTVYRLSFEETARKLKNQLPPKKEREMKNGGGFIPSIYLGEFQANIAADTWIDTTDWGKGQMFTGTGLNLGRYWPKKGPQLTLYHPFLVRGTNYLMLFEMDRPGHCFNGSSHCHVQSVLNPLWSN